MVSARPSGTSSTNELTSLIMKSSILAPWVVQSAGLPET